MTAFFLSKQLLPSGKAVWLDFASLASIGHWLKDASIVVHCANIEAILLQTFLLARLIVKPFVFYNRFLYDRKRFYLTQGVCILVLEF